MIRAEDISRLDVELDTLISTDQWMKDNDIDFDAVAMIVWSSGESILEKMAEGEDFPQALGETVANAFMLGWETFRQYGPRS